MDTDADGLSDSMSSQVGTDPDPDTDNDGVDDGTEYVNRKDPLLQMQVAHRLV